MARLPFAYQEVEWIESHGTEYIDTGTAMNKTSIKGSIDFQLTSSANGPWIAGVVSNNNGINTGGIEGGIYNNAFYTGLGFTYSQYTSLTLYNHSVRRSCYPSAVR